MVYEGNVSEREAKRIFEKMFDHVQKTKHTEFYDYLVNKGNINIRIEVKYRLIKHKSAHINMKLNRFKKFTNSEDFLFYFMTNKGNIFLTPEQIIEKGHVHYNEMNPHELSIFLRVKLDEQNQLNLVEPEMCRLCHGKIKEYSNAEIQK